MARKLIGREQSSGGNPVGGAEWIDGGRKLGVLRMLFGMAGGTTAVAAPPPPPATTLNTTTPVSSPLSGTLPFSFNVQLADGQALPNAIAVTGADAQVVVRTTFPSGYASFAQVSGTYTSTANVPTMVVVQNGTKATGTNVTAADVAAVSMNVVAGFGTFGSVDVATLLDGAPTYVYYQGHKHYHAMWATDLGTTGLDLRVYVDYWPGAGRLRGRIVWGRTMDDGAGGLTTAATNLQYIPSVVINGTTVFNNGGVAWDHWRETVPCTYIFWIGGDPQVTALPAVSQIHTSRKWPYAVRTPIPQEAQVAGLYQAHTPNSPGQFPIAQGGAGYAPNIGMRPAFDYYYLTQPEIRTLNAVKATVESLMTFPIDTRDRATHRPMRPSSYPTWTWKGPNGQSGVVKQWIDTNSPGATPGFDMDHAPTLFSAFSLTGDGYFYDCSMSSGVTFYMSKDAGDGLGTNRIPLDAARGVGWCQSQFGACAAMAFDDDPLGQDFKLLSKRFFANFEAKRLAGTPGSAAIGLLYQYQNDTANEISFTEGRIRTFMHLYLCMGIAQVRAYGIFSGADKTNCENVTNSYFKFVTMLCGPMGDVRKCGFSYVGDLAYEARIAVTPSSGWAQDGGDILDLSYAGAFGANVNGWTGAGVIYGINSGAPGEAANGRLGEVLTCLALAIDFNYPGAQAAIDRILNSLSGPSILAGEWQYFRQWSILPRPTSTGGGTPPPPPPPPPPEGSPGWYVTLAGMADGTWMQIPGSSMFGVNPDAQHPQNGSPQNRVDCWNSMVLNRTNGDMRSPGNGGHSDWQGNEVLLNNLLRTDVASWNWSYERQPAQQQYAPFDAAPHNLIGEKVSAHTYWSVFDTRDGYITCLGVDAVWGSGLAGNEHILHKYDTTAKSWVGSGSATNTAFSGMDLDAYTRGGMAIHQVTGEIYFTSKLYDSVRILNPANNTVRWGSTSFRGATTSDYVPCAIDHTRGHVVWLGNNFAADSGRLHRIAANTAAEFVFTGPAADVFATAYHGGGTAGRNGYGAHYDATLGGGQGRYIIKTKVPGEIVLMRPMGLGPSGEDGYCERLTTTGGDTMPLIISNHIVCNRFLPLDMEDGRTVYVYVPNEASNIWVIRPPLS